MANLVNLLSGSYANVLLQETISANILIKEVAYSSCTDFFSSSALISSMEVEKLIESVKS